MSSESNFDNLDPQDLIEGVDPGTYQDPTPAPVQPDEPDYIEPAVGVSPVPFEEEPA